MTLLARLKALLQFEPAVLAWAANGGIALILGYLLPLTTDQLGAVTVITGALATAYTAATARPIAVSVLTGSLATIATAVAAFGLHLDPQVIATGVAVLNALLGLLTRQNLTPEAKLKAHAA